MSQSFIYLPGVGDVHWKAPVASVGALPAIGNLIGDARIETSAFGAYVWNGSSWAALTGGSGGNGFGVVQPDLGTSPTATQADDTLIITSPLSTIGVTGSSSLKKISLDVVSISSLLKAPTIQKFTSGSGTYTTPTSPAPLYIKVTMVGGGGGGGASGSSGWGAAGAGTASTFGTTLLSAGGGALGPAGSVGDNGGGAGGTSSLGSGPIGIALTGGQGGCNSYGNPEYVPGSNGGSSAFGGAGSGTLGTAAGGAGAANTGGGGGSPSNGSATGAYGGAAGGSGGYVQAIITSPATTYAYVVGAGGSAGTAGAGGIAGGAGGSGLVVVEEHYQ